ncbi:beta-1,4-N-acetylgalactosaminyltransferase bre-4-like [Pecten maximus]|uniref:beta-1,4-N-acetylgalactosaminyltransferase bre-4-like n=1 Tax=Pecten maximus TaxID=6579 RepID=UPI001457E6A9|nr:beta-1,4-N-acetylgalactosaminyltransferase bre-4-like [Pecten maximus]
MDKIWIFRYFTLLFSSTGIYVVGLFLMSLALHQVAMSFIITNKVGLDRQRYVAELSGKHFMEAMRHNNVSNTTVGELVVTTTFDGQYSTEVSSDDDGQYSTEVSSDDVSQSIADRGQAICVQKTSNFHGREAVDFKYHQWSYLENAFNDTLRGGHWRPRGCKAQFRIAIIIPYQDRDRHLKLFISNVIPKLQRQMVDYTIFVVEQAPGNHFNRGMMRNIGFVEASRKQKFDCYIFNDVDTIIEDDRNMFICDAHHVRHIGSLVDVFNYTLLYKKLIGGILSVTYEQFVKANGYSNSIYVWGGEDDDLFDRFRKYGYKVSRPPAEVGHITTLIHKRNYDNQVSEAILKKIRNHDSKDGLNTLDDKYSLVISEERQLFTWLYVRVSEELVLKSLEKFESIEHHKGKEYIKGSVRNKPWNKVHLKEKTIAPSPSPSSLPPSPIP